MMNIHDHELTIVRLKFYPLSMITRRIKVLFPTSVKFVKLLVSARHQQ